MTRFLFLLLAAVLALPAAAQPATPLYDTAREAGASASDAAALAAAFRASVSQEAKLLADDAALTDQFGSSVALFGDRALIGARNDSDNGTFSGSAYVFVRSGSTWTQEAKLLADDGGVLDQFGFAVALSENRALVGALNDDDAANNSGAAYVFVRSGSTWTQEAKLVADDGEASDQFSTSLSLSEDRALIGAVRGNSAGTFAGAAYVFARSGSTWTQEAKLTPSVVSEDEFGRSVSLSGDRALIGAPAFDDGVNATGAAFIFTRSGSSWAQEAVLVSEDAQDLDSFGFSVSLSGDEALVGAPGKTDAGDLSGAAYVFDRFLTSWTQRAKLVADDAAAFDQFGEAVALSGDRAFVATLDDADAGPNGGTVYLFERSDGAWTQEETITADDGADGDEFGGSISASNGRLLVGAAADDDAGPSSGSAYVFFLDGQGGGEIDIALTPLQTEVPAAGGPVRYTARIENTGSAPQSVDAWARATLPNGNTVPAFGPITVTLQPGQVLTRTIRQTVPGTAPTGGYTFTGFVGDFPSAPEASASFGFTKLGGAARTGGAPALMAVDEATGAAVQPGDAWQADTPATPEATSRAEAAALAAYPNPFGEATTLRFGLSEASAVRLVIYDVLGREIAVLADGPYEAGSHEVQFDAQALPSGVYVVRLSAGQRSETRRVTVLR